MPIKVVTIDFWNTLFDSSNGIKRNAVRQQVLLEQIKKYDFELTEELYNEALKASWEFFNKIWINDQRTPHTDETIGFFWSYLKLPYSPESIKIVAKSFAESILDFPPLLVANVKEVLPQLAGKYQLGIISDTGFTPGTILLKLFEQEKIIQYFSSFSFSDETGVSKPHPKAFLKILNDLNCEAQFAVHIGDIEKTDIVGAKNIGMRAIRFNGDKTATLNMENSKNTLADAETSDWSEIPKIIRIFD
jgi:putative hydrolase of the HAD superfamily